MIWGMGWPVPVPNNLGPKPRFQMGQFFVIKKKKIGADCELFSSEVSIILEWNINYFDHFGGEMFFF